MPVRALVAAGSLFSISANSVRVALARLLADGAELPPLPKATAPATKPAPRKKRRLLR